MFECASDHPRFHIVYLIDVSPCDGQKLAVMGQNSGAATSEVLSSLKCEQYEDLQQLRWANRSNNGAGVNIPYTKTISFDGRYSAERISGIPNCMMSVGNDQMFCAVAGRIPVQRRRAYRT